VERRSVSGGRRGSFSGRFWKAFFTAIFLLASAMMVVPFVWMLAISLKTPMEIMEKPAALFPRSFAYFENYKYIFGPAYNLGALYFNSIKVTGANVLGGLATSACAGYAFARLRFKGRDAIFLLYLATLMIPPQVTIIPRFIMFNELGMIDSHLTLILPGLFSVIGTFLLRQYFMQMPFELTEAAKMDGAGEYRIFGQIFLPLAAPALMSVLILNFSWHWNDYQNALIFLRSASKFTLPLGMNVFSDVNSEHLYYIAAAGMASILPVILVFLAAQNYFVKGLTAGAVKG
jgi:multiple sugar transport system permease protein